MLNMKERALAAFVVVFVFAVAANFVIPVRTFEVKLVTIPAGDGIFVQEHHPFNISCQGLSDEEGKFHFMRWLNTKGHLIPEGVPGVQEDGKNALKLLFTDPKVEDSGVYKCMSGYDTNTLEKSIKITFYSAKPTFYETFENITAEEGEELILNCSALGDGNITYEWYKYEDKISVDPNSSISVVDYGSERSALVIREVSSSDEGMYVCEAKNEHGFSSKMYGLIVFPSTGGDNDSLVDLSVIVEAENITSDSVQFFIFNLSESATQIEVKYRENRDTFEYRKKWNYGDDYKVEGLTPGGLYTFQFRILPSKNNAWSKIHQVILLPDAPDVVLQSLDKGTVKLGWFRTINDLMRETIEGYELKYYSVHIERGNNWIASRCPITIQIPACSGSSYTVSDLNPNTYYEIQLRARTSAGYGEPYKQKIFIPHY